MKLQLLILFNFLTLISSAQSYDGPESVEYDAANNRWLVSNTVTHAILARDSAGMLSVFADSINSGPYGIEIVGDTLFACSGSRVKGFLLSDGSMVFNISLGASFLNGITHDNSGNLYATDFTSKSIYRVNIAAQTDTVIANNLGSSPNGILFDPGNNRCIFVSWGNAAPIRAIDLSTYAVTTLTTTSLNNCDGIARDGHGNYYVSNWGAQSIVMFDSSFSNQPVTVVSGLSNPADIFYEASLDTLAIPNANDDTVDFISLTTVSIDAVNGAEGIHIYPNPTNGNCIIETGDKSIRNKIQITDSNGKIVLNKNISSGRNELDLNYLDAGYYTILIRSGEKLSAKRILITR